MRKKTMLKVFLAVYFLVVSQNLFAEPWLSNHFAQNCAACHAPGRENRPMAKRRCTLTCQGCHVSPSGGGLRSSYGKWNEDRWLSSFKSNEFLGNKKLPAPLRYQEYNDLTKESREELKEYVLKGAPLKEISQNNPSVQFYNRKNTKGDAIISKNESINLLKIPEGDPYRQERSNRVSGGGDLRYNYYKQQGKTEKAWLMSAEVGVRARPTPKHTQFVVEGRYMGNYPSQKSLSYAETNFTSGHVLKSAYLLVDDLPFNSYLQGGDFTPLFGNSHPDHTRLSRSLAGFNQRSNFQAFAFGTAPNVPFMNAYLIQPQKGNSLSVNKEKGYALNLGGRFVTLGLSFLFSHWDTTDTSIASERPKNKMQSVLVGAQLWKFVVNLEALAIRRDSAGSGTDSGKVVSSDVYFKAWRQFWLMGNYTTATSDATLKEGKADQYQVGLRSFLFPGMDLETKYEVINSKPVNGSMAEIKMWVAQLHLFF